MIAPLVVGVWLAHPEVCRESCGERKESEDEGDKTRLSLVDRAE